MIHPTDPMMLTCRRLRPLNRYASSGVSRVWSPDWRSASDWNFSKCIHISSKFRVENARFIQNFDLKLIIWLIYLHFEINQKSIENWWTLAVDWLLSCSTWTHGPNQRIVLFTFMLQLCSLDASPDDNNNCHTEIVTVIIFTFWHIRRIQQKSIFLFVFFFCNQFDHCPSSTVELFDSGTHIELELYLKGIRKELKRNWKGISN